MEQYFDGNAFAIPPPTPAAIRALIRQGAWRRSTEDLAPGFVQANLVVVPDTLASDFRVFFARNPQACPVLAALAPGDPWVPSYLAAAADIRVTLPRYHVYRHGRFADTVDSLAELWRDDLVAFLLGCSFGFDGALRAANLPVRHVAQGRNVPMFRTSRNCIPAGTLHGPLVVSCRPMPADLVAQAAAISTRYPLLHGAPVHVGDPAQLGIADLSRPDWGDPVVAEPGDIPMFWACGVTPQAVALASGVELMLTHAPGHMFVADVPIGRLDGMHTLR